jgi:hypothetical protein
MYLTSQDAKAKLEQKEVELRNNIFISNPTLYGDLFGKEAKNEGTDFEVEEVLPENEDDVRKLLSDLKREGIID